MTYRTPADYRLRAYCWHAMILWCAAFWIAVVTWVALPAARAIADAASAGPPACAHVAQSDRAACVSEGR